MLQVLEDGQRLLPGLPGLGQLAGSVAGVAEVGEGVLRAGVLRQPGIRETGLSR